MTDHKEQVIVPASVLQSAQFVMSRTQSVRIDDSALPALAERIKARLDQGIDTIEAAFGTTGVLENDVNLVFFETAVNFCFWADVDQPKWVIERSGERFGGWYALAACFDRAATAGTPVYDAGFMAELTTTQARQLFAGVAGSPEIPLLEQRVKNLNEAGRYLLQHYDGSAMKLLASVDFSAPRLAEKVTTEISSFRDGAMYDGSWVWILKRAQILGSDLSQLHVRYPDFSMRDCEQLTAFADYRLPQILRHYGVMVYSVELSTTIDTGTHLEAGSEAEVAIRAATIDACERLKATLVDFTSADIDLGLWLLSQDMRDDSSLKPHHRTLGQFY